MKLILKGYQKIEEILRMLQETKLFVDVKGGGIEQFGKSFSDIDTNTGEHLETYINIYPRKKARNIFHITCLYNNHENETILQISDDNKMDEEMCERAKSILRYIAENTSGGLIYSGYKYQEIEPVLNTQLPMPYIKQNYDNPHTKTWIVQHSEKGIMYPPSRFDRKDDGIHWMTICAAANIVSKYQQYFNSVFNINPLEITYDQAKSILILAGEIMDVLVCDEWIQLKLYLGNGFYYEDTFHIYNV